MEIPNFRILKSALDPYDVRLVGGAVRDILSGNPPKDFDFCTNAKPEVVMQRLSDAGHKVRPTGLQHGTVTVICNGLSTEVTTLRVDKRSIDGRHAEIEFTDDWRLDAARRDFTINAMSMDLDGNIYDYFNGREHLKNKLVIFVGDPEERIKEDYLRILRYFRFCCKFDYKTEPRFDEAALRSIKNNYKGLSKISGERITNEFWKILDTRNKMSAICLYIMRDTHVLDMLNIQSSYSNYTEYVLRYSLKAEIKLASLFSDIEQFKKFCEIAKLTSKQRKDVEFLIKYNNTEMTYSNLIRLYYSGESYDNVLDLAIFSLDKRLIKSILVEGIKPLPISTADIAAISTISRKKIHSVYMSLLDLWIKSDFKMSKPDLLDCLNSDGSLKGIQTL